MGLIAESARLFGPLLLGFAVHGVCMRYGLLRTLARPIDAGAVFRGQRLFGENKTYRGIVAVALGTGLGFVILTLVAERGSALRASLLGVAVGGAAMVGELPNSFVKRRLEIAPGSQAKRWKGALFHVLDQIDVVGGAWLVLWWFVPAHGALVLATAAFVFVTHQAMTVAGYALGMRKTWR